MFLMKFTFQKKKIKKNKKKKKNKRIPLQNSYLKLLTFPLEDNLKHATLVR
ncbi:hypothetical protein HanIR_Chr16g0816251 [Helianthus annuus]|nr:hypothetical protein HanIR_Chr16g0816251 [Helianthus annuus]